MGLPETGVSGPDPDRNISPRSLCSSESFQDQVPTCLAVLPGLSLVLNNDLGVWSLSGPVTPGRYRMWKQENQLNIWWFLNFFHEHISVF